MTSAKSPNRWERLRLLFFHLSLLLGFPSMLEGLERIQELSGNRSPAKGKLNSSITGRVVTLLSRIYGEQTGRLLRNLAALHPDVPHMIVRDVYGKIFGRSGLNLGEREIINITVLAIQKLDKQLFSHLRGAMRAGIKRNELRELLFLLERTTKRKYQRAFELFDDVVSQRKKL